MRKLVLTVTVLVISVACVRGSYDMSRSFKLDNTIHHQCIQKALGEIDEVINITYKQKSFNGYVYHKYLYQTSDSMLTKLFSFQTREEPFIGIIRHSVSQDYALGNNNYESHVKEKISKERNVMFEVEAAISKSCNIPEKYFKKECLLPFGKKC